MWTLVPIVVGAALYGFLNGYKDAVGITATVVSSRAMRPREALLLIGLAEFCGPFLFGTAVASRLGHGLILEAFVTPTVLIAALGAAIVWNLSMILLGLPASSTHALVGSLLGAAYASASIRAILVSGVLNLILVLLLSPLVAFVASYCLLKLALFLCRSSTPRINVLFKNIQIALAFTLGLSHGSNDAQKSIGLIVMGLAATGYSETFEAPLSAVFIASGALALGAVLGGERVMRTVGWEIFRIRPIHGFAAQLASNIVVFGATVAGYPLSTTQVVSGTVMGAGSSERLSRVRWNTVGHIALAWLVTLPASALLAGLLWRLLSLVIVV